MQEVHVIFYEFRNLNEHERNYVTHNMELVKIVHALKMWRHYLLGMRFVLIIDHSGMKYLFDQPKLNARQGRSFLLIDEIDFEIKHIKGKENRVADVISRNLQEVHLVAIRTCSHEIRERIK